MQQKINIQQLSGEISLRNGCSQSTSDLFLKELFAIITEELINGKNVTVAGLGEFKRSDDSDNNIVFIADNSLSELLNQPFSCFEPIELSDDISEDELFEKSDESNDETADTQRLKDDVDCVVEENAQEVVIEGNNEQQDENDQVSELIDVEVNGCEVTSNEISTEKESIEETSPQEPIIINEEYIPVRDTLYRYKIVVVFIIGLLLGFVAGYMIKDILFNNIMFDNHIVSDTVSNVEQTPNVVDSVKCDTTSIKKEETSVDTVAIVVDKITTTRYLTTMARDHYGDMNFWVYIYEENSDKLGHPNKIKPGTEVVIPPKEKYNINVLDTLSIKIAKEKGKEIYAKYR